jgi:PAS domain S-box-containing protein
VPTHREAQLAARRFSVELEGGPVDGRAGRSRARAAAPAADFDPQQPFRAEDRSRRIVAELAAGFVSFDADWRFVECNGVGERLFRRRRADLLGQQFCDVAGMAGDSPFADLVRRVGVTKAPEDVELTFRGPDQNSRLLAVHAFPLGEGVAAEWRDITAARAAQRRLALSEARYHEIAHGLPAAAWVSRVSGGLEYINQAMTDALGRPRRALLGDGWLDAIDPADRPHLLSVRDAARGGHSSFHCEGRFRRADGELRIIELHGRPRFDSQGRFRGHIGIASDVTETREAEERQRLLVNELNHRVKNTLAMVQSLVRQTLRDHDAPPDVERDVTERLIALSAAHDVLSRERWKDAELGDVVGEVMRPYEHAGRIRFDGPKTRIAPKVAIALSMALHELTTNAVKYGALSIPDGRVELSWRRAADRVLLRWRERDGPPVAAAPRLSGFGSLLLGRVMAVQLGQPARIVYAAEGLTCRLDAPVADGATEAAGEIDRG